MSAKLKGLEERIAKLEAQLNNEVSLPVVSEEPKVKAKRAPSAYNVFIKEEIARLKANVPEGELFDRKNAFKNAAANWKLSKNAA